MANQADEILVGDVLQVMNNLFDKINANWDGEGPDLMSPAVAASIVASAVEFSRLAEVLVVAVATRATPALLRAGRPSTEARSKEVGADISVRDLASSTSQASVPSYNQLMGMYKAGLHQGYKYAALSPS